MNVKTRGECEHKNDRGVGVFESYVLKVMKKVKKKTRNNYESSHKFAMRESRASEIFSLIGLTQKLCFV